MRKSYLLLTIGLLTGAQAMATPINITIADGQAGNGATAPWSGTPGSGAGNEDNETEPRTYTGDIWDLEAFVFNPSSSTLSLLGTFDFKNGVTADRVTSGAVFIKTPGNASWNYAYVLNFNDNTYTLYNNFTTTAPTDIPASGPVTVKTGTAIGTGNFSYTANVVDPFGLGLERADVGLGHNEIDLPLNLIPTLTDFDSHFTISCGNDDLEGSYHAVPDSAATAGLLGIGILGIIVARKKIAGFSV
jgi:hypothetical protein